MIFQGYVGSSFTGDIAVDDIKIIPGDCEGRYYVNPNQTGLFWLCYDWGGGQIPPPPPQDLDRR